MKKIFFIAAGAFLLNVTQAQTIDRSKRPKAGPAPVITIADPVKYILPNGITVLVVENHTLPKVSASFIIDGGPLKEGDKAGKIGLMGQMLNEGTTKHSKAEFDEAVEQMGAEVALNAGGASASALTRYFDKAFMLMAEGLRNPVFSQSSFDKLKSQSLTALKASERSAKSISGRVVNALAYGKNNPFGEFESETTLNAITLNDIKDAYKQYITPSRSYLTFVGDIKPEAAKALAIKAFGDWKGTKLTLPVIADVANPRTTEIDLVDVPSAVQSEITVLNLVKLSMSNPDYFPVLLANYILGGGSSSYLFMNLREKHGFTYGAYSSVSAGRYQTKFSASASVRNEKADSAVAEILNEIKRIRTEKVSTEELQSAKALFNGSFALGMENPGRIAGFASSILINNLPKDFYKTYLQKVNAVTVNDIQRVAQKYFNYANTRVVVVGKADQVRAGLEKMGYPVSEYDSYANPVTASASANVVNATAQEIIAKYIAAIGGEAALKNVNSILIDMEMETQGMKMNAVSKQMNPNKTLTEVMMNGNTVLKSVFDGEKGYQSQMGQKQDMQADEITAMKAQTHIISQLGYTNGNYKLEVKGTEKINGKDAYKIIVTDPANKLTAEFYDVNTGYLLKTEISFQAQGMDLIQTRDYGNYTKVNDIYIPYSNDMTVEAGGNRSTINCTVKSVKINEGVSAEDFK